MAAASAAGDYPWPALNGLAHTVATLQQQVKEVSPAPDGSDVSSLVKLFTGAAAGVSHEASRFGLSFSEYAASVEMTTADEHASCTKFGEAAATLTGAVQMLNGVAGPSLAKQAQLVVARVLRAVADAIEATREGPRMAGKLNSRVGIVWETCKAVERMPKTNRAAVKRALLQVAQLVKVTLSEVKEEVLEAEAALAAAGDAEGKGDEVGADGGAGGATGGGDVELEDEPETVLSAAQLAAAREAVAAMRAVMPVLKATLPIVDACAPEHAESRDGVVAAWLANVVDAAAGHSRDCLEGAVVDLGAAALDDDAEELRRARGALRGAMRRLQEVVGTAIAEVRGMRVEAAPESLRGLVVRSVSTELRNAAADAFAAYRERDAE